MAYATVQDIIDRYGEGFLYQAGAPMLEDREIDVAAVERLIADAGEEIDLELARRYSLPLVNPPNIIRRIAMDIALALLPSQSLNANDEIKARAKDARALLKRLGSGDVTFGEREDAPEETAATGLPASIGPPGIFGGAR